MNLRFPQKAGNILSSVAAISFSGTPGISLFQAGDEKHKGYM
jgi:hypothetical protein